MKKLFAWLCAWAIGVSILSVMVIHGADYGTLGPGDNVVTPSELATGHVSYAANAGASTDATARASAAVAMTNLQSAIDASVSYSTTISNALRMAQTNSEAGLWAGIVAYSNYVASLGYIAAAALTAAAPSLSVADAQRIVQSNSNAWLAVENGTGSLYVVEYQTVVVSNVAVASIDYNGDYQYVPQVGDVWTAVTEAPWGSGYKWAPGTIFRLYTTNGYWYVRDEAGSFSDAEGPATNPVGLTFVDFPSYQDLTFNWSTVTNQVQTTNAYPIATDPGTVIRIAAHDADPAAHPNRPTGTAVSFVSYTNALGTVTSQVWTIGGAVSTNFFTEYPAMVPRTGQTTSYATGDDGDLEKGVAWPNPRFTVLENADCVRDNLSGIIWTKNANMASNTVYSIGGTGVWAVAFAMVTNANAAAYGGRTDWRVPNAKELHTLVSYAFTAPAIPNSSGTAQWTEGNPFVGVKVGTYAGSTTIAGTFVGLATSSGLINSFLKTAAVNYVWLCAGPD